jgi:hypothetical protein
MVYGQTYTLWMGMSSLKPDIPGNYTFVVKNLGPSPVDVDIIYGSVPSQTTITTYNVTNTRTTKHNLELYLFLGMLISLILLVK